MRRRRVHGRTLSLYGGGTSSLWWGGTTLYSEVVPLQCQEACSGQVLGGPVVLQPRGHRFIGGVDLIEGDVASYTGGGVSRLQCHTQGAILQRRRRKFLEFLSPAERFSFKIFIPLYGAPQAQKNLVFLSLKALCMKKGLTFLGTRGAVGLPTAPAPAPHHPHPSHPHRFRLKKIRPFFCCTNIFVFEQTFRSKLSDSLSGVTIMYNH